MGKNRAEAAAGTPRFISPALYACLMLTLSAFCFAVIHVIGRGVRTELPPVGLSFWRWLFGAFILLPLVYPRLRATAPIMRAHFRPLAFLGGTMVASTTFMLIGLNFTTAINSSIINATQPVFTVSLAMLFLSDRLRLSQAVGVALGLAGIVAMISKMDLSLLLHLQFNDGDFFVLLGAIGYAVYSINIYKIPTTLTPVEALFVIIISGCLIVLPFYIVETIIYKPVPFNTTALAAIVTMSLAATVFGMLLWNRGNQIIGPSRAGMFSNLIPVFATALAVVFLAERLHLYHIICVALVSAGIFLVLQQETEKDRKL